MNISVVSKATARTVKSLIKAPDGQDFFGPVATTLIFAVTFYVVGQRILVKKF